MSPARPGATPDQIAAMLRDGATYRQIKQTLRVSASSIAAARKAYNIPPRVTPLHALAPDEQRAAVETRHPRMVAMLRDGATVRQILDEIGGSGDTISSVRAILGLPSPRKGRAPRTLTEALTRYLKPHGDGHAHWTGPTSEADGTGAPRLWAGGRRYNPRRESFTAHHRREPDGQLTTTCTEPACIAGAHLADRPMRAARHKAQQDERRAERRLDAQLHAIFGPDAP